MTDSAPELAKRLIGELRPRWYIGQCVSLACLFEATIPKPGNVHRGADFEDLSFMDFVVSAVIAGETLSRASLQGVGRTIRDAVLQTQAVVGRNTNLGIVLLLGPLAAVPLEEPLRPGVRRVLASLTAEDARLIYEAIRSAGSTALGQVPQWDVAGPAPERLLDAMQLAAERDLVARQYATDYYVVFEQGTPWLLEALNRGWSLTQAVVHTYLRLLAEYPDSLIARKGGDELAAKISHRAAQVLAAGYPGDEVYERHVADFDFFLRCDTHRRNPGTTADLIAAVLFVLLRDHKWVGPWC